MGKKVLVGIDGGGTYTRVAVTDEQGSLLAHVHSTGAASLNKDLGARENVRRALAEALDKAGCLPGDVMGLAAGIAGLDSQEDLIWARELTDLEGLLCPCNHVNDAVAAHHGAFLHKPGILAVSGTGSIVFGITEKGQHVRNYDFNHYADAAARYLSYDVVYHIMAGETDAADQGMIGQVLEHFGVPDLACLIQLGSQGFEKDRRARDKWFGDLAPVITQAALDQSPLAQKVCDQKAAALVTGIGLVGACFEGQNVSVTLIGSVGNSPYIKGKLTELLAARHAKAYTLAEPALPAVLGAVIMAMEQAGLILGERVMDHLRQSAGQIG